MKKFLFFIGLIYVCNSQAKDIKLWGIDISETHPEISNCKVEELKDYIIFNKVKITANSYTFANDQPNYACWYGEESDCFSKVTEYLSNIFGNSLDVYSYAESNTYTLKPSFFNIWKYDSGNKHYMLMLSGSGEGMTLNIDIFPSDKKLRSVILSTIKSFHYSIKPEFQRSLEK